MAQHDIWECSHFPFQFTSVFSILQVLGFPDFVRLRLMFICLYCPQRCSYKLLHSYTLHCILFITYSSCYVCYHSQGQQNKTAKECCNSTNSCSMEHSTCFKMVVSRCWTVVPLQSPVHTVINWVWKEAWVQWIVWNQTGWRWHSKGLNYMSV